MNADLDKNGEITTEEFNTYINSKDDKGQDVFTEEQKKEALENFKKRDLDGNGTMTNTEAIKYDLQNGKESISQDELKAAYGDKKASEMMKYDKDGNGKLDKTEFDEATKKKGFLDIDFKDPKTILAIIGIAITVIGVIVGLCVYFSRKNKKKKEEQAKANNQLQSGNVNMSVSSGNSAEQVHTPISTDMQQQSNDAFNQYTPSPINNEQQLLNLNDSRNKSMDIER